MVKNHMERIFGVGAFERKVPGTQPGEEASVRYVSFDDPASISNLFDEVLDKIEPNFMKSGGAILEGTKLELPEGGRHGSKNSTMSLIHGLATPSLRPSALSLSLIVLGRP